MGSDAALSKQDIEEYNRKLEEAKLKLQQKIRETSHTLQQLEREYEQKLGMQKAVLDLLQYATSKAVPAGVTSKRSAQHVQQLKAARREQLAKKEEGEEK